MRLSSSFSRNILVVTRKEVRKEQKVSSSRLFLISDIQNRYGPNNCERLRQIKNTVASVEAVKS